MCGWFSNLICDLKQFRDCLDWIFILNIIRSNCDNSVWIGLVNWIDAIKLEFYYVFVMLYFSSLFLYFHIPLYLLINCLMKSPLVVYKWMNVGINWIISLSWPWLILCCRISELYLFLEWFDVVISVPPHWSMLR